MELLPIILYLLLIILIVVTIIFLVRLIKVVEKVDKVMDEVEIKVRKLDTLFDFVDRTADTVNLVSDTVINFIVGGINKIFKRKKKGDMNE